METIYLTGKRPIHVDLSKWENVASYLHHDGEVYQQANREWRIEVYYRAMEGRYIVYGIYDTTFSHETRQFAGYVVECKDGAYGHDDDLITAISDVCTEIGLPDGHEQHVINELPAIGL